MGYPCAVEIEKVKLDMALACEKGSVVEHTKTGNFYHVVEKDIINATNAQDGQIMILYKNIEGKLFVREEKEFWEKFKLIGNVLEEVEK